MKKVFNDCLYAKIMVGNTENICKLKYPVPEKYIERYSCFNNLGIPKDITYCKIKV